MASVQMRPNRQLRELLEEEQEPFILDAYLLERMYSRNASRVEPEAGLSLNKPSKVFHLQRIKKGVLYPSKLLKSAYNKFLRIKNSCDGEEVSDQEMSRNSNQETGSETFSSSSSSTVYNSCPESDNEEASTSLHCQDHTPKSCNERKDELMFDCVRDLIENNGNKIKEWGKQSAKATSIDELLSLDFEDSIDEWRDLKLEKGEFAMAVGDDILEELWNQLVMDMLHSLISV